MGPTANLRNELNNLGAAELRLANCTELDEVLEIRDAADTVRIYAQKQRLGLRIQNHAAKIKIQAERRIGESLSAMNLRGGDRRSKSYAATLILRLSDLGISRSQSARWQQEARIPNSLFEAYCREVERRGDEISSRALLRFAQSADRRREPVAQNVARRSTEQLDEDRRPAETATTTDLKAAFDDIRGHVGSVDRIFRTIRQRSSAGLHTVEVRGIARYLHEVLLRLDEIEVHLGPRVERCTSRHGNPERH